MKVHILAALLGLVLVDAKIYFEDRFSDGGEKAYFHLFSEIKLYLNLNDFIWHRFGTSLFTL